MKQKIILVATLILAIVFAIFATSCKFRRDDIKVDVTGWGSTITCEPPQSGSPQDYSGLENVSFMAYNLANASQYSVQMKSTVNTKVVISYTQQVECYKDYKDGVMVVTDISKSSLVNTALQTCFVNGRAMWRKPLSNKASDWQGKNTAWQNVTPEVHTFDEYKTVYGLPSVEFSVYVLNSETLTKWDDVVNNGDGTFSQTIYPDCELASKFYAIRMKNMGGLVELPVFNTISITYTFTSDWKILKSETKENYAINKGIINSDNCVADTIEVYSYDEDSIDISAYDEFFKNYINAETAGDITTPTEITPVDCLSESFGSLITEPKQLLVNLSLNGKEVNLKVYVDINNWDIRIDAGDVKAYYLNGDIYLNLNGILLKTDVEGLKSILSKYDLPQVEVDEDSLLQSLCNGEFTITDQGAILSSNLSFEGFSLPVSFVFNKDDNNQITLDYAEIGDLKIQDYLINATIRFDNDDFIPTLSQQEITEYATVTQAINTITDFIDNNTYHFDSQISVQTDNALVNGNISGDLSFNEDIKIYSQITLGVNNIKVHLDLEYKDGCLYISLGRFGVVIQLQDFNDFEEKTNNVVEAVKTLLELDFDEDIDIESLDVQSALPEVLKTLQNIVQSLKAFNEEEDGFNWFGIEYGEYFKVLIGDDLIKVYLNAGCVSSKTQVYLTNQIGYIDGVKFFDETQIATIYDYAKTIKEVIYQDNWNLSYEMTVNNAEVEGVTQYNVNGNISIVKETDNAPISLKVGLIVVPTNANDKSYVIDLTYVNEEVYIQVSYYNDCENENYNPLRIQCQKQTVSSVISSVNRLIGLDLSFINIYLPTFENTTDDILNGLLTSEIDINGYLNDYISLIEVTDDLSLALNGNKIYGNSIPDIILSLSKGEDKLSFQLDRLTYSTAPLCWIDGKFDLLYEDTYVEAPTEAYIDVSTVDCLLNTLIDSFTTNEDDKLQLLDNYYFAGKITGKVGSGFASYNLEFDTGINLDVKNMVMTATVSAGSKFAINSGKYLTYLTIDFSNQLAYMMRYQYEYFNWLGRVKSYSTPVITYRSMSLTQFGDDYLEQIFYMTNMGDTVAALIRESANGSDDEETPLYDVGSYLKGYTYNQEENYYNLLLNGTNFSKSIGDINLTVGCNDQNKVVSISGSMKVVVTLGVNLSYENITSPNNYTLNVSDIKTLWQKEGYQIVVKEGMTTTCNNLTDIITYVEA